MSTQPANLVALLEAMKAASSALDEVLSVAAEQPVRFVLVVEAGDVTQYVSNRDLPEGMAMLQDLLERWKEIQPHVEAEAGAVMGRSH